MSQVCYIYKLKVGVADLSNIVWQMASLSTLREYTAGIEPLSKLPHMVLHCLHVILYMYVVG